MKKIKCIKCGGEMECKDKNVKLTFECQDCERKIEIGVLVARLERAAKVAGRVAKKELDRCSVAMEDAIRKLYNSVHH